MAERVKWYLGWSSSLLMTGALNPGPAPDEAETAVLLEPNGSAD